MSILQNLAASSYFVADPLNPIWWTGLGSFGRRTDSGTRVNPEKSLGLAAYYACLRNISEDIAKLPFKVYRQDGRDKTVDREHNVYKLLNVQPNPDMTAKAWREVVTHWAIGWGRGISEIERDNATRPTAFWPIHPSRTRIIKDKNTRKLRYIIKTDDIQEKDMELPDKDVLHIHGLGGKGITGYPLSMLAAQTIGLNLQADKFAAEFFAKGSVLSGYLLHPGDLGKPEKENIRAAWQEEYGGAKNSHKTAVLSEGMEYKQLGIPPDQAQFLESRQFGVEEIARWFRMPPHKIQHLQHATFSNISEQNIEYVVDCLLSWATSWEQEVNRKCFNATLDPNMIAEHVFNMLLRGDDKARGLFYRIMFMTGAMSQNDIRAAENLNSIGPVGNTYYVPANMIPAEQAVKGPPPQPTQAKQPDGMNQSAALPVVEDALLRVLTKEARAAERASEKFLPADPIGFQKWATDFYAGHAEYVAKELLPPFKMIGVLSGNGVDADAQSESYAKAHCTASRLALGRSTDVKKTVLDWLVTRAGMSAPILIESCSHETHDD